MCRTGDGWFIHSLLPYSYIYPTFSEYLLCSGLSWVLEAQG